MSTRERQFQDGRTFHRRGEQHPNARLGWTEVREIRARYGNGRTGESQAALARVYGVTQAAIASIVRGRTWHEREPTLQPTHVEQHARTLEARVTELQGDLALLAEHAASLEARFEQRINALEAQVAELQEIAQEILLK
jgi:hypothetical protein